MNNIENEIIEDIQEVNDVKLGNIGKLNGSNGSRLGVMQMVSALSGYSLYDGYEIRTNLHKYMILIDNAQSCCESWGYICSDDNVDSFIGKTLVEVVLTDTALNMQKLKEVGLTSYEDDRVIYCHEGGVQFIDFKFNDGSALQFAVYNAHNGYYGHNIIVAIDQDIICNDTL